MMNLVFVSVEMSLH